MAFPQVQMVPFYIILFLMINKYAKVCGPELLTSLVCKIKCEILYDLLDLGFTYFYMCWKRLDAVGKAPYDLQV